ncbi:oxidoreductase [Streptomyces sp. NPDC000594]|uniref:oxidoreductase n=1 Tax=Streptomyces sp. NPDC000594 TaxID=3154261 RepID=UPI0033323A5E
MAAAYATLGLAPAMRTGGVRPAGACHLPRDFLDFIVNGRPLLFRLSEGDAVSPLASDVPPAIPPGQACRLLPENPALLDGGRRVIYACPECGALGCGAVTAVVERAGPDVIWRDFAWQTGEPARLERDGYPGVGPFRFRAGDYRAVVARLLAAPGDRRALLLGAGTGVLPRLAAALRAAGVGADLTRDLGTLPVAELRRYGAVVFGRGVGARVRSEVLETLRTAGADAVRVSGLAPVVPLLVAQVEEALDRGPCELRRLTGLTALPEGPAPTEGAAGPGAGPGSARTAEVEVAVATVCRVRLDAFRLDRSRGPRQTTVLDATFPPGRHRVPLPPRPSDDTSRPHSFLVARALGQVLITRLNP